MVRVALGEVCEWRPWARHFRQKKCLTPTFCAAGNKVFQSITPPPMGVKFAATISIMPWELFPGMMSGILLRSLTCTMEKRPGYFLK